MNTFCLILLVLKLPCFKSVVKSLNISAKVMIFEGGFLQGEHIAAVFAPRAKHTLQSMGSSWQATSPLSRSQLFCCLLPHPWGNTCGHWKPHSWEKGKKGVTGIKQRIFFFNRSSLLQIHIVKSNSFQMNWAQYLGMWLVYRATKHSVSFGTNGLVLENN